MTLLTAAAHRVDQATAGGGSLRRRSEDGTLRRVESAAVQLDQKMALVSAPVTRGEIQRDPPGRSLSAALAQTHLEERMVEAA